VADRVTWIGSGRLGLPERATLAFALGCDAINVGREAMLAVGCIQAQRCHTGHCPTGVTAQSAWLERGIDTGDKSARVAAYLTTLRQELLTVARACGVPHPAFLDTEHIEVLDEHLGSRSAAEAFGYQPAWGLPATDDLAALGDLLTGSA
jgi:glutamate synthase domain-containing protein 2